MPITKILSLPAVYRAWSHVAGRHRALDFHASKSIRAKAGMRVLDIGCGTADVLEYLPDVDYVGFDAEAKYITAARRRFGHRGTFHNSLIDDFSVRSYGSFDIVLATGVIHHLDDAQALSLMKLARTALVPGGRLVTWDGCFKEGQSPIARWLLQRDRGQYVRTSDKYLEIARQVFPQVHHIIRSDLLNIPYTVCLMNCVNTAQTGQMTDRTISAAAFSKV